MLSICNYINFMYICMGYGGAVHYIKTQQQYKF